MFAYLRDYLPSAWTDDANAPYQDVASAVAPPAPGPALAAEPTRLDAAIEDEESRANPADAWLLRGGTETVEGGAPVALDEVASEAARDAAMAIFESVDGLGTDEDRVLRSLQGKSPEEAAAVAKAYEELTGQSLTERLADELSGTELEAAQAAFSKDPAEAKVASLINAFDGIGTDEAAVKRTLQQIRDPEELARVRAELERRTGTSLEEMIAGEMSDAFGTEEAQALALARGDVLGAQVAEARAAMEGGWLSPGLGTDEEALGAVLEKLSPDDRKAFADRWQAEAQVSFDQALEGELEGPELDLARAQVAGDAAATAAAKMAVAADGAGTDEDVIFAQLEGKSGAEREAILGHLERYGGLEAMISEELGEKDAERAALLARDGKLDPKFALAYAVDGLGTNDELIERTLAGLTTEEARALAASSPELVEALKSDLSGRDEATALRRLAYGGKQTTAEDKLAYMADAYDDERGEGAGVLSGVVDGFSDSGDVLDRQHARAEALRAKLLAGSLGDADQAALSTLAGDHARAVGAHEKAVDSVADNAALAAGMCLGPQFFYALQAKLAAKAAIKGQAFGIEEAARDTAMHTVEGIGTAAGFSGGVGALATKLGGRMAAGAVAQRLVTEGVKGAVTGAVNGVGQGLLDERVWEGPGNGALRLLETVGTQTVAGAVGNVASGGVDVLGDALPRTVSPALRAVLTAAADGGVSAATSTVLDPNVMATGNWGEAFTRSAVLAMAQGGAFRLGGLHGGGPGAHVAGGASPDEPTHAPARSPQDAGEELGGLLGPRPVDEAPHAAVARDDDAQAAPAPRAEEAPDVTAGGADVAPGGADGDEAWDDPRNPAVLEQHGEQLSRLSDAAYEARLRAKETGDEQSLAHARRQEHILVDVRRLEDPALAGRVLEVLEYSDSEHPQRRKAIVEHLQKVTAMGDPELLRLALEIIPGRGSKMWSSDAQHFRKEFLAGLSDPELGRWERMARLHELASRAPELNGVTPTGNVVVGHQPGRNGRPAQPNTILGHGAQEPTLITADRPVTFWTQGGYAIHADVGRLAESFTVGGSRASEDLVKAWILWSDHVSRGGTASDFGDLAALEGLGYGATGVFELEGAHSVLPGTRFPEMNISPEHETRPPDGVRTQVSPEPNAPGVHAKLSTILEEIPGSGVVTVLACRGDRVNHPTSKTSR